MPPKEDKIARATRRLHKAARSGDDEAAKQAIRDGAYVDDVNSKGLSPIKVAAKRGHAAVVSVLSEHANSITKGIALRLAAKRGRDEVVRSLLIEVGKDIRGYDVGLALEEAANKGYVEAVKALLEHSGKKISGYNIVNATKDAAEAGREDVLSFLKDNLSFFNDNLVLFHGSHRDTIIEYINEAFEEAFLEGDRETMFALLQGTDCLYEKMLGRCLVTAAEQNLVDRAEILLTGGVVIEESKKMEALMAARYQGNSDMLNIESDDVGWELFRAILNEQTAKVQSLLFDHPLSDSLLENAAYLAVSIDHVEIVAALFEASISSSGSGIRERPFGIFGTGKMLKFAAEQGSENVVSYILDNHHRYLFDDAAEKALKKARKGGFDGIVDMLESHMARAEGLVR